MKSPIDQRSLIERINEAINDFQTENEVVVVKIVVDYPRRFDIELSWTEE